MYELKITASNAQEFAQDIVTLAFMVAPHLKDRLVASTAAAPVETASDPIVETVDEPKKPSRKAKKSEIIEHDETEVKEDVSTTSDSRDDAGDTDTTGSGDNPQEQVAQEAEQASTESAIDPVEAEITAESNVAKSDEPCMTIDELRKYTINQYLNVVFAEMPERSAAFKDLLKRPEFALEKIADLPAEKVNAFKAVVDGEIAKFERG